MSEELEYTLAEFCKLTRLNEGAVRELVGVGLIEPRVERAGWYFTSNAVSQCVRAERLIQDLELTPHGAALALELLEQNRRLRQRLAHFERMLARLSD